MFINPHKVTTGKAYLKKLEFYYFVLISIPLILFIVNYFRNESIVKDQIIYQVEDIHNYMVTGIFFVALLLVYWYYRKKVLIVRAMTNEKFVDKLVAFHNLNIVFYILLSFVSLFVIAVYYVSSEGLYAVLYSALLILFSIERPSVQRMFRHLRLPQAFMERFSWDNDNSL